MDTPQNLKMDINCESQSVVNIQQQVKFQLITNAVNQMNIPTYRLLILKICMCRAMKSLALKIFSL